MIRMLLYSLLFFFGPALLMFALHRLTMMLRLWLRLRRLQQAQNATVIDITPEERAHHLRPGMVFIVASMLVAGLCAWLAWQQMDETPAPGASRYVPAHMDAYGNLIPGQMLPAKGKP